MNEGTRSSFPRSRRRRFDDERRSRYGIIYVSGGSTAQSSIGTSPALLTEWVGDGPASGVVPDAANDLLTVEVPGMYQVQAHLSFSGTASTTFTFTLYRNGEATACRASRLLNAAGDLSSVSLFGFVQCGQGDELSLYVEADGASKSVTLVDAQLAIQRVSAYEYDMAVMS